MTPRKQLFRHRPEDGVIGDCWRSCFACLLDMEPTDVPHFMEKCWEDPVQARANANAWLKPRGLSYIEIPFATDLDKVLEGMNGYAPGMHYLLGGNSRNGTGHSVICLDGAIMWDPALDDSGIVGPMDDGYYWVTFLVPTLALANYEIAA